MSMFAKLGVAGAVLFSFACSSARTDDAAIEPDQPAVTADEAIVHGAADRNRHAAVVAIATRDGHLCSGSLIAPDVVLTARHCVSQLVGEGVICPPKGPQFGATMAAGDLAIVLGDDTSKGTFGAYGRSIHVPRGYQLCDADIALIVLDRAIHGIAPLPLARDISPHAREKVVAVGFGRTSTNGSAGVRRFRSGIPIVSVSNSELVVGESTCFGDSGGPAIDEETGEILGVLSRGGSSCDGSSARNVYTRVSAWLSLIDPLVRTPAGGSAPAPDLGDLGDPCTEGAACATGVCVSAQPSGYCSRACGGDAGRCPAGYRCAKSGDHGVCARKS